jgi:hypothetical protein
MAATWPGRNAVGRTDTDLRFPEVTEEQRKRLAEARSRLQEE